MTARDPFEVLGLRRDATLPDARAAYRRLAFDRHPDRGGSNDEMQQLNVAFDAVVADISGRARVQPPPPAEERTSPPTAPSEPQRQRWLGQVQHDDPSFVIDALPTVAFEALLVVASWIGEVLVDDPPYLLEVHLREPSECWCRLELLPEAGASTVNLIVAAIDDVPAPWVEDVRDVWVQHLNQPGAFDHT